MVSWWSSGSTKTSNPQKFKTENTDSIKDESFIYKDRKIDVKHEAEAPHRIKTLTLHLFPHLLELGLCLLSAWSHQPPFRPVENFSKQRYTTLYTKLTNIQQENKAENTEDSNVRCTAYQSK